MRTVQDDPGTARQPDERAEGRFSVRCPRHGVEAELRVEAVSGSLRAFSCSVAGEDDAARRRCQAACARWVLGDEG